jgi:hypothetical protein
MKLVAALLAFGALAVTSACADFYDEPSYGSSYYGGSYGRYDGDGRYPNSYRVCDERGCGRAVIDPRFTDPHVTDPRFTDPRPRGP